VYDGVKRLIADYQMQENGVKIVYDCEGVEEKIRFRFLSWNEPKRQADGSLDVGVIVKSGSGLIPTITKVKYSGHRKEEIIYAIDFEVMGTPSLKEEFEFVVAD
jgi:hypothetical protein